MTLPGRLWVPIAVLACSWLLVACSAEDTGGAGGGDCQPTTCADELATCGQLPDGCGGVLECGVCGSGTCVGYECKEQGQCVPYTCTQVGAQCGEVPDGCDGVIQCGDECPEGSVCDEGQCKAPGDCGADPVNECGGCSKLETSVGTSCACESKVACEGDSVVACDDEVGNDVALPATDDSAAAPVVLEETVESLPTHPDVDGWTVEVADTWFSVLDTRIRVERPAGSQTKLEVCVTWTQTGSDANGPASCEQSSNPDGCCREVSPGATMIEFPVSIDWLVPSPFDDSGTWGITVTGSGTTDACESYKVQAWF